MNLFKNQKEYENFNQSLSHLFGVDYIKSNVLFSSYIIDPSHIAPPWNKGEFLCEEHKQAISESTKGRVWSEERNKKVSEAKLYHWNDKNSVYNSQEFRNKQSQLGKLAKKHKMKPILAKNINGSVLQTDSITQMCSLIGCKYTTIKRILDGTRKTHKGWKFEYYGE